MMDFNKMWAPERVLVPTKLTYPSEQKSKNAYISIYIPTNIVDFGKK